jgi:hypothetical protein
MSKPVTKNIAYERSFASHEKAKYWNYEKNGLIRPENVTLTSHKKYWFKCDNCNHDFESILKNINKNNSWCLYCHHLKLCNNNECIQCFENSFASQHKAKFWSDKNKVTPREVFRCAYAKYWFNCECGHTFESVLKNVSGLNRWCPYCCTPCQKICNNVECNKCFNRSFACIEKCKFLVDKNVNPRMIIKGSEKIYKFNCIECNNNFDMRINCVVKTYWCPYCILKTEQKLYINILNFHPLIIRQCKAEWCRSTFKLPYDFCIEEYKLIIELDGISHFKQVSNWPSPQKTHQRDLHKLKCANENGYSMIRILQSDVWFDKFDWLNELIQSIEKIIADKIVQNIYICKNNEYNEFEMEIV